MNSNITTFYNKDQNTMLKLFKRDESFGVALNDTLFFKAEGHYTNVFFYKDCKLLLPFGLSQIDDLLQQLAYGAHFAKIGRSHIINMDRVVHASITKECFTLIDKNGAFVTIAVSKNAIKQLTAIMKGEQPEADETGEAREMACNESGGVKIHFRLCATWPKRTAHYATSLRCCSTEFDRTTA